MGGNLEIIIKKPIIERSLSECTGVTKEVRNGVSKYYLMKGALTATEEEDTSWVSGSCVKEENGWFRLIL